jgi:hypothetical protein
MLIRAGGVDEVAMLVLRKVSNYVSIVNKLGRLNIAFSAWECVEGSKSGNLGSFFEADICVDEGLRRQSFERRREQAWYSFLRLVANNAGRLSDNDIYTLVEKMTILMNHLNEVEETLLQLINVSPEFTLEKTRHDNCVKKCDIDYGNRTKVIEYFMVFTGLVSAVAIFRELGVPLELITMLIPPVVGMLVVSFIRDRKRQKLYKACIDKCYKENRIVRLSESIDYLLSSLNYIVDGISRLLGVNSSSAITERVAYSGYRT